MSLEQTKTRIMTIIIDVDGCLAGFVEGACEAHNRPNPYNDPKNHGQYDMVKIWGMTQDEFWAPLSERRFWSSLALTPDAREITNICREYTDDILLATQLGRHDSSACGKMVWLEEHFPDLPFVLLKGTGNKNCLATPDSILVDDRDANVRMFPGRKILYPRLWNHWFTKKEPLDHLRDKLDVYFGK
jgi:5'(3')-deoxyribonucleotidase